MSSYNKVILMGNLTRDPEMRVSKQGLSIVKLGLALNRKFSTKDGERKEETTFVDVDAFGKQAEVITKYLHKGSPLMLEGRLKLDQWEAQDGQKRSKLGVVLESFQFVFGSGSQDSGQQNPTRARPATSQDRSGAIDSEPGPGDDSLDGHVPF